jgi:peroxiredoxin
MKTIFLALLFLVIGTNLQAQNPIAPAVGSMAPDFALPYATKEVCTMRDNFAALQGLDAEILAISGDYVWSHHEWAKFHNLPFKLLSDHSHATAKLYDSFNEKSLYNRRTVFVVDKMGKIAYENLSYSVADLQDFEKLKSALATIK